MGCRFDGTTIFGWSDPNPGRYYTCPDEWCPYSDSQNRKWDEGVPDCPQCRSRMVLAADQTYPNVREA
jgi:hypothetical protein